MAKALWLPDVLRDAGLTVHARDGWATRGRDDFAPVGVMWHHTVTSPSWPDLDIDMWMASTGTWAAPPPLCNISTNRDGSVSIIAAGTANHGGAGSWRGVSGNRHFVGDEMKNLGTAAEPWPERQLESARIAAAAILRHLDADASMLTAHKEYATPPGRKSDPHTLNMDAERTRVAALIEEVGMPLSDQDKAEIRAIVEDVVARVVGPAVWNHRGKFAVPPDLTANAQTTLVAVEKIVRRIDKAVRKLAKDEKSKAGATATDHPGSFDPGPNE